MRSTVVPELSSQEMLLQIDTARRALETQLNTLRAADPQGLHQDLTEQGSARLQQLNFLRDQLVGGAKGVPLATLRAEITSAIASTLAYTSDARGSVNGLADNAQQSAQIALYEASTTADRTVRDFEKDFYERRIFDPYLKFASAADEDAYRQREAKRQQEIEKARAEHTPQGELRATNLSIDQLKDAGAHGADRSPDYKRTMSGLTKARDALSQALPVKAAEGHEGARIQAIEEPVAPPIQTASLSADLLTKLRGAGVSVPDQQTTGHGLTQNAATNSGGIVRS